MRRVARTTPYQVSADILASRLENLDPKASKYSQGDFDFDSDIILGFESGADDYVTKPLKLSVLLARIRAQFRQHELSEDAVFTIGPYNFEPAAKRLLDDDGREIRLTDKETSLLKYLCRAGDRVVPRDAFLREVWGYNAGVTTHTIETHIYRLRQKIEKDRLRPRSSLPGAAAINLAVVQTIGEKALTSADGTKPTPTHAAALVCL
jgi:DNA-binding winged helix-turn-helix (wHTH) protein